MLTPGRPTHQPRARTRRDDRSRRALLIWCEDNHPPFVIRISKRREDPAGYAKVGMAMVRLFDGVLEAERNPPESGRGH